MSNLEFAICIVVGVVIFISMMMLGIYLESRAYNKGICPECGDNLRNFDTDSQGGRGYCCDKCGYNTWVSYYCVDKNFTEE